MTRNENNEISCDSLTEKITADNAPRVDNISSPEGISNTETGTEELSEQKTLTEAVGKVEVSTETDIGKKEKEADEGERCAESADCVNADPGSPVIFTLPHTASAEDRTIQSAVHTPYHSVVGVDNSMETDIDRNLDEKFVGKSRREKDKQKHKHRQRKPHPQPGIRPMGPAQGPPELGIKFKPNPPPPLVPPGRPYLISKKIDKDKLASLLEKKAKTEKEKLRLLLEKNDDDDEADESKNTEMLINDANQFTTVSKRNSITLASKKAINSNTIKETKNVSTKTLSIVTARNEKNLPDVPNSTSIPSVSFSSVSPEKLKYMAVRVRPSTTSTTACTTTFTSAPHTPGTSTFASRNSSMKTNPTLPRNSSVTGTGQGPRPLTQKDSIQNMNSNSNSNVDPSSSANPGTVLNSLPLSISVPRISKALGIGREKEKEKGKERERDKDKDKDKEPVSRVASRRGSYKDAEKDKEKEKERKGYQSRKASLSNLPPASDPIRLKVVASAPLKTPLVISLPTDSDNASVTPVLTESTGKSTGKSKSSEIEGSDFMSSIAADVLHTLLVPINNYDAKSPECDHDSESGYNINHTDIPLVEPRNNDVSVERKENNEENRRNEMRLKEAMREKERVLKLCEREMKSVALRESRRQMSVTGKGTTELAMENNEVERMKEVRREMERVRLLKQRENEYIARRDGFPKILLEVEKETERDMQVLSEEEKEVERVKRLWERQSQSIARREMKVNGSMDLNAERKRERLSNGNDEEEEDKENIRAIAAAKIKNGTLSRLISAGRIRPSRFRPASASLSTPSSTETPSIDAHSSTTLSSPPSLYPSTTYYSSHSALGSGIGTVSGSGTGTAMGSMIPTDFQSRLQSNSQSQYDLQLANNMANAKIKLLDEKMRMLEIQEKDYEEREKAMEKLRSEAEEREKALETRLREYEERYNGVQ